MADSLPPIPFCEKFLIVAWCCLGMAALWVVGITGADCLDFPVQTIRSPDKFWTLRLSRRYCFLSTRVSHAAHLDTPVKNYQGDYHFLTLAGYQKVMACWPKGKGLLISYDKAGITNFKNHYLSKPRVYTQELEMVIRLVKGYQPAAGEKCVAFRR